MSAEADAAKARGNAAFSKGDFETAVKEFTAAIDLNPNNHVYFSNRSGAYASLSKYDEALKDAESCVSIKPDWAKGYSRKGLALFQLGELEKAKEAYEAGVKVDGNNAQCKQGLQDVEAKLNANPMGQLFGPSMWGKLQSDPVTREYLKDPNFVQKMKMMQSNPNMMSALGSDPQMSAAIGVILGLGSSGFQSMNPNAGGGAPGEDVPMKQAEPEPQMEEEEEIDPELEAEKKQRADAVAAKEEGNKHYKKREFDQALVCYDKAINLDPDNLAFSLNKAAVYYEQKEYGQCEATCKQVIETETAKKGYDFQLVAKAYYRMGNAFLKQENFDEASKYYDKAVMEYPLPAAKAAIKKLDTTRKAAEAKAYLSKEKSEEHKTKGNEFFKEGKWTDAIEEYTEALRRDPDNYRVYSNRAACYTKLMDWNRGLEDCDACLKLDPNFVKVYIRKGKIQHFLKHYHKALATYEQGLALDPKNPELLQGRQMTTNAINMENSSGNVDPARAQEAMKDPEIQAILQDPIINNVLQNLQNDPASGQRALKDPTIMAKIQKLVAAGILQVGGQ